jgi:DNA-binding transcriptional LysR family regulator
MATTQPDIVGTALLIRQGQVALRDVPEAYRAAVAAVLAQLTDAQAALLASRRETRRRFLGRSRVYTTATS